MRQSHLLQILQFAFVGCLGFVIDLAVIFAFIEWLSLDPFSARIPAWIAAVTLTYTFNLLFTFRATRLVLVGTKQRLRRYCLYVLSQLAGGAVNFLSYALVVSLFHLHWFIGLAIGTLVGMVFNYLGASMAINRKNIRGL